MSAKLIRLLHPFRADRREVSTFAPGTTVRDALPAGNWAVQLNGRRLDPPDYGIFLQDGDILTARPAPGLEAAAIVGIIVSVISAGVSAYQQSAARRSARHAKKGTGAVNSAPFYAVNGSRNEIRPFGTIQQHYGTLTVTPDLLMPTITSVSDTAQQVVQCLFCIGKGFYSPVALSSIRYGEQVVEDLGVRDFAAYDGLSTANQPSVDLARYFVNTIEEPLDLELTNQVGGSVAQVRTTQDNAQSFDVQTVFPQGLIRIAADGKQRPMSLTYRVRYREVGETDWIVAREQFITGFIPQKFAINTHVEPASTGQFEVEVQTLQTAPFSYYPPDRGGNGAEAQLITGDATWLSLRSYLFGAPVIDEEAEQLSMFGLQIEANELVNGQLDQISIECTRKLPTWTEADGWSDVDLGFRNPLAYTATANPAWAYANELRDAGVPDDEIDAAQIKRWADYCDTQGWECNLPYNDSITLDDSLSTIASCGQAFPTMKGSLFSVVFDEPREPVAAFGPSNMRELVITQAPLERVDAMQVRFSNANARGRLDERVICLNGHTADTAEEFRTIDVLNGLTDPALVERYVRLEDLKQRLRKNTYAFTTDWSAVVCEVGDVVVLQHHGALLGDAQVEVDSYTTKNAGAHIDEIFVYPAVRIEAGRTYSLRVRTRAEGANGGFNILTLPITNPLTAGVQMMTALTVTGSVDVPTYLDSSEVEQVDLLVGQPAFLGEPDTGLVMVTEVKISKDGSCQVQAVDFAPELFDEELLETVFESTSDPSAIALIPPAPPVLAPPVATPEGEEPATGSGLIYSRVVSIADYFYTLEYVITLAPAEAFPPIAKYQVQYRYDIAPGVTSEWTSLPDIAYPAENVVVGPVVALSGVTTDVRIYAVSVTNVRSAPLLIEGLSPVDETPLGFALGFTF